MRIGWQHRESYELPTTTIYFSGAMADQIGPFGSRHHAIWRVSANTFLIPAGERPQILIIRQADLEVLALLRRQTAARILYLIDDDIWSGATDTNLPLAYRQRLFRLALGITPILQRADSIYVTASALQERLRHRTELVHPGLVQAPKSLEHHDGRLLKIVFPGTRSHLKDLEDIAAPVARFLKQHPDCELHTFLGRYAPLQLRLPNAVHHAPQDWATYQQTLRRERFHIGIAPALPTRFNAARSHNKILELATFGAAPVYGNGRPFRYMAEAAGAALICGQVEDWFECLSRLYRDRPALRQIAAANTKLALQLGDPRDLRSFWQKELGLSSPCNNRVAA